MVVVCLFWQYGRFGFLEIFVNSFFSLLGCSFFGFVLIFGCRFFGAGNPFEV